jgi:predicted O-methyltransferase YrrM
MAGVHRGAALPDRMVPTAMSTPAAFHEEWFCEQSCEAVAELVRGVEGVPGAIIEIGAWEGRSTVAIANAAWPRRIESCDTWQGSGHEISEAIAAERDVFTQWQANILAHTKHNVTAHRMDWRDFVPTIKGKIAFCFIDAKHSYDDVFENLRAIIPKLSPGAIVCGDDMHHGPVQDAVFDMFGTDDVYVNASLWIWQAPDNGADMDAVRLRAIDMALAPTEHERLVDLDRVNRLWMSYVREVSEASHAAAPGTVAYLYRLCDYLKPSSILDLGSGLSSAVFRKWATERRADCEIMTFDTNQEWLDKTSAFLTANELPTDGLYLWDGWISGKFDLVFHDLAGGETRETVAPLAAAAVADGGVILFDDAQHADHLAAFERAATDNGIELYSLAKWTSDAIERFALIGFKNGADVPVNLGAEYERLCTTESDIFLHLPRLATVASKSQHVIELGARSGVSTVAFLHGLELSGGWLTSVDISPQPAIGEHDRWRFIQGDDTDPAVMEQVHGDCDVLFIDTSHAYEHTLWELRNWGPKVRQGGLIVCHDTELQRPWDPPCPETDPDFPVKSAIEVYCAETGYRFVNFPECWGLGIIEVR